MKTSMNTWQPVLDQVRLGDPRRDGHDLRAVWRGAAFLEYAGQPEPIVRARAFERALAEAPVTIYRGDRIAGSRRGFRGPELPAGAEPALAAAADRGQRDFTAGFDHTLADYPTLLALGIDGLQARVRESARTHVAPQERVFLDAVMIALDAFSRFVVRYADAAADAGDAELEATLRAVAGAPPTTFHQAMQLVWLTQVVFVSEGRYANALGRLDQYLLPFYRRDVELGLSRDEALDLLCHLWAHVHELGEVTNICIAGQTPDGDDATNELSYLCLEATRLVGSPHTNLSARFHDATPEAFHRACFEVIRTGIGFPAIFNDHVLVDGLIELGIPPEVARDHCMVGCIETMLAGRQQAWSDSRFNTPDCLLEAIRQLRGKASATYAELIERFRELLAGRIAAHCRTIDEHIARFPVDRFPDPFLSALTRDCIGRARDVNDGGAEFARFHGVCVMGLGTLADSLAAVRKLVFEKGRVSLDALAAALEADFVGHEPLRQTLLHKAPKYGNDDPYADDIAADIVQWTSEECLKHRTVDGGRFVSAMAANTANISAGKATGATPDGRHAHAPLSDAASPSFGRDRHGPTAFLRSVARPDYRRVLTGSVINMKFEPHPFADEDGARRFTAMTHFFVRNRIPELQFNFTGDETLRAAQADPEAHASLVVRVSGFSAYFVRLDPAVQADIIRRHAHV